MKNFVNLFSNKVARLLPFSTPPQEIHFHLDGISMPGMGSIRLSNIPKNLTWLAQFLITIGNNTPAFFTTSFIYLLSKATAQIDSCVTSSDQDAQDLYFDHPEAGNGSLLVTYSTKSIPYGSLVTALENSCGFSMSRRKPGSYGDSIDCFCRHTHTNGDGLPSRGHYDLNLYQQILPNELITCAKSALADICASDKTGLWFLLAIGGFLICLCCCCYHSNGCDQPKLNRDHQHAQLAVIPDKNKEEKSSVELIKGDFLKQNYPEKKEVIESSSVNFYQKPKTISKSTSSIRGPALRA